MNSMNFNVQIEEVKEEMKERGNVGDGGEGEGKK